MPWVFALLALVLIVALGLIIAGRLPAIPQPSSDRYVTALPPRPGVQDIDALRLPVSFRGYRMEEVDAALQLLRNRIAELESQTQEVENGSTQGPATHG